MKKLLKWTGIVLGAIFLLLAGIYLFLYIQASLASSANMAALGAETATLTQNGIRFRDLNKNGVMDIYEDPTADTDSRVNDLVSKMTLEEKAGAMFINVIGPTLSGEPKEKPFLSTDLLNMLLSFVTPSNTALIVQKKMNNFNPIASLDANLMAHYNNAIQQIAERMRLGIPITLSSDPRHVNEFNPGTTLYTPAFCRQIQHDQLSWLRRQNYLKS